MVADHGGSVYTVVGRASVPGVDSLDQPDNVGHPAVGFGLTGKDMEIVSLEIPTYSTVGVSRHRFCVACYSPPARFSLSLVHPVV
jgi:hypothetical protein